VEEKLVKIMAGLTVAIFGLGPLAYKSMDKEAQEEVDKKALELLQEFNTKDDILGFLTACVSDDTVDVPGKCSLALICSVAMDKLYGTEKILNGT